MSDNIFWPKIETKDDAKGAAIMGAGVMGFAAVVTAVLSVLSIYDISYLGVTIWSLIDAALYAALCYGIIKLSRIAAVLAFLFYILQQYHLWTSNEISGTPVLAAFFVIFLFQSVRGSIYYHKLNENAESV